MSNPLPITSPKPKPERVTHLSDVRASAQRNEGHAQDHKGHDHHGHGHAHHDHTAAAIPVRSAELPGMSLLALSAGQRLLFAVPVITLLWLATFWAMGGG